MTVKYIKKIRGSADKNGTREQGLNSNDGRELLV